MSKIKVTIPNQDHPLIYAGEVDKIEYVPLDYRPFTDDTVTLKFDPLMTMAFVGKTIYLFDGKYAIETDIIPEKRFSDLFERFNFKSYDKISIIEMDIPHNTEDLEVLGVCLSLVYISGKLGYRESRYFEHKHSYPHPTLFKCNNTYIISGGRLKIKDWLYH